MAITKILRQFSQIPVLRERLQALIDDGLYPRDFCDWVSENVLSDSEAAV